MAEQIVAVGGGKGGVGKSLVAANLAVALAQAGRSVVLIDADLGAANQHTLFGIERPSALLEHFISKKVSTLAETLVSTQLDNLSLICGGMPVLGAANPQYAQKMRLLRNIEALDVDCVILDIGAGTGFNTLDLFNLAQTKIAVFTPQLTSLHNGYGFLKAAIHRQIYLAVSKEVRNEVLATDPESGGESILDVMRRLESQAPEEASKAREVLLRERLYILGNMIQVPKENAVIGAVGKMIKDHLKLEAPILGILREGEKIRRSVNERCPFMLNAGIEANAVVFRSMAATLTEIAKEVCVPRSTVDDDESAAFESLPGRKHPRFLLDQLEASLLIEGVDFPCVIRNIAYGGILIDAGRLVPSVKQIAMTIAPWNDHPALILSVEERNRDDSGRKIGYAFVDIDAEAYAAISALVAFAAAAQPQLDEAIGTAPAL